ncbi:MAG: hypothetical protein Harvfovirus16_13 [Harvfovirus sp.]|uniref:Uncharacterized protein n=1 Tax=Harvfovirus sp. TaxID=2487768 RepID=A0A3G5A1N1_9VIRU|nr:MAG: hypothetical protein Harvfovirus16_13 [Harvfovirus sp.]
MPQGNIESLIIRTKYRKINISPETLTTKYLFFIKQY